jgi:hypothetical protein
MIIMTTFVRRIATENAELGVTCFRGDKRAKGARAVLPMRCKSH